MRKIFKQIISLFLIPLTRWYLRKERQFRYEDVVVKVSPGVFHPGLFYSTKFILEYLNTINLTNRTVLELGCGTGLISIVAAKRHASVTASDLSTTAIQNAKQNALINNVSINIVLSDLFHSIGERFDLILINPPYYSKKAKNESELAWYCGEQFEYFQKLFSQLNGHLHSSSQVVMVLTKGCDIDRIRGIAKANDFSMDIIKEKDVLFDETDYLFSIAPVNSTVQA